MNQEELIKQYKKYSESQIPLLSLSVKEKIKQKVISNLSWTQFREKDVSNNLVWTFMFTRIAVTAVCILALLSGTAYASFSSLPGDKLYPLKRTVEDTQVKFAPNPETKARLQVKFAEKRFQELELLESKNPKTTPTQVDTKSVKVKLDTPKLDSPIATPTETEKIEIEDSPKENFAKREISRAILNLENTKTKLEKKGRAEVAKNLDITIKEFTSRAEKHRKRRMSPKGSEELRKQIKIQDRQKESNYEQDSEENN